MIRWQYRRENVGWEDADVKQAMLTECGDDGWDLVMREKGVCVFKKRKYWWTKTETKGEE